MKKREVEIGQRALMRRPQLGVCLLLQSVGFLNQFVVCLQCGEGILELEASLPLPVQIGALSVDRR